MELPTRPEDAELPASALAQGSPGSPASPPGEGREVAIGRRVFLGLLGLAGLGVAVGPALQDRLATSAGPLANLLPSGGRFRIYTVVGSLPHRERADYRLRVDGLVDEPYDIGYVELTNLEPTAITRDFQCVTGWRVDDVRWRGVPVGALLDRARPRPGATALRFHSFDGVYTESLTLEQARRDDVLCTYELDGSLLSDAHGGPVRLYVAPMYGYKSLKWLDRIEVVDRVVPGYWEERGYDIDAWIGRSNGRDDEPVG